MKITLCGRIDGIRCQIEFDLEKSEALPGAIRKLRRDGLTTDDVVSPSGKPICPIHGCEMDKREKQGDVWYSHKLPTGEHCRGIE